LPSGESGKEAGSRVGGVLMSRRSDATSAVRRQAVDHTTATATIVATAPTSHASTTVVLLRGGDATVRASVSGASSMAIRTSAAAWSLHRGLFSRHRRRRRRMLGDVFAGS